MVELIVAKVSVISIAIVGVILIFLILLDGMSDAKRYKKDFKIRRF